MERFGRRISTRQHEPDGAARAVAGAEKSAQPTGGGVLAAQPVRRFAVAGTVVVWHSYKYKRDVCCSRGTDANMTPRQGQKVLD